MAIAEAHEKLRARRGFARLSVGAYLDALRSLRRVVVEFPEPDKPVARLRRLGALELAMLVLEKARSR